MLAQCSPRVVATVWRRFPHILYTSTCGSDRCWWWLSGLRGDFLLSGVSFLLSCHYLHLTPAGRQPARQPGKRGGHSYISGDKGGNYNNYSMGGLNIFSKTTIQIYKVLKQGVDLRVYVFRKSAPPPPPHCKYYDSCVHIPLVSEFCKN